MTEQEKSDAAHAVIKAYIKANGIPPTVSANWGYIKPARAQWDGKKAFNMAMWLGVGTAAVVVSPLAMIAFPILGLLSVHYNEDDK